jgi:hypothetical protein
LNLKANVDEPVRQLTAQALVFIGLIRLCTAQGAKLPFADRRQVSGFKRSHHGTRGTKEDRPKEPHREAKGRRP